MITLNEWMNELDANKYLNWWGWTTETIEYQADNKCNSKSIE